MWKRGKSLYRLNRRRIHRMLVGIQRHWSSMWIRTKAIWFWDWSATWRWYDWLFIGAFGLSVALHEYLFAIICLVLCAFSCIAILCHGGRSLFVKVTGSIGICGALGFLIYVTVQEKEQRDWSHLSRPISLIFYKAPIPRHFVPTIENWAPKQEFKTQFLKQPNLSVSLSKSSENLPPRQTSVDTSTNDFADVASKFFRDLNTWADERKAAPKDYRWGDATAEEFRQMYADKCESIFDEMVSRKIIKESDYINAEGSPCKMFPRTLYDLIFIQKAATKLIIVAGNMKR